MRRVFGGPAGWTSALALIVLTAIGGRAVPAGAASIVVSTDDPAGSGFNDPTQVAPVGGNAGTTRGAQRLRVVQQAAAIWGSLLPSGVTIRVLAHFGGLPCSGTGAVLASAGPDGVFADFSVLATPRTWYPAALADRLAGHDLDATKPDIDVRFNALVDDGVCLGSSAWYYGLDHLHGDDVDLLPVALHELAHGLGFLTLEDYSSGEMFSEMPDVFLRHIYDDAADMAWTDMTESQRVASATRTGHVVWSGSETTAASSRVLTAPALLVRIESPSAIARRCDSRLAAFSAPLAGAGVTAPVVVADDGVATTGDACTALQNAAQLAGSFALIDRGNCSYPVKALAAQAAGAVGAIIVNDVEGSPQVMAGSAPGLTIPVVSLSLADGNRVKDALASGTVVMSVGPDATRRAGANAEGQVMLYAPSPLSAGSSISHFDVTASPDLLMEPIYNGSLTSDVDLTLPLMEDIGWFGPGGSGPNGLPRGIVEVLAGYPNPFGSRAAATMTVRFLLDRRVAFEASILDLSGRLVRTLARETRDAGTQRLAWDGTDEHGNAMRSGIYLFRVQAGDASDAKRVVLAR